MDLGTLVAPFFHRIHYRYILVEEDILLDKELLIQPQVQPPIIKGGQRSSLGPWFKSQRGEKNPLSIFSCDLMIAIMQSDQFMN